MSVQTRSLPAVGIFDKRPLPAPNALMTFRSGCGALPSVLRPTQRCWGSLRAWKEGRGHLRGCRAPPGRCSCLWSPPSPERALPSPPRGQRRGGELPGARLPWRSSGSAAWKPCGLGNRKRGSDVEGLDLDRRCVNTRLGAYRGPRRGGCRGWWRLRTEEGGRRDAGCRGTCRLRTAEEALGNGKLLPLRHQTDAGEWGRCRRHPGRSQSPGLVSRGWSGALSRKDKDGTMCETTALRTRPQHPAFQITLLYSTNLTTKKKEDSMVLNLLIEIF